MANDAVTTADLADQFRLDLDKMKRRLAQSEDLLAKGELSPELQKYHLETVGYYRAEVASLRATLVTLVLSVAGNSSGLEAARITARVAEPAGASAVG